MSFKIWSGVILLWRIRDNVNSLTVSLGQDGDGFLWNTMFNDSLLRSATENRWDRHFILINVPNGFAHKTGLFLHWCMFSLSLSPSYFQVDNACANPSRLTAIIRIIRGADIWYEPSWAELSGPSEPPRHQNNSVEFERSAPEIKFYFHLQMQFIFIYVFIFLF